MFDALFAQTFFGKIFRIAAQKDIGTAARHVGGDRHRAESARLRNDFRLAFVVLRVENVMLHAVADEKARKFFRFIDRYRTHENGLSFFVTFDNLAHDRLFLCLFGSVNAVAHVVALHGQVGGDFHNVERIDRAEFAFLGLCGTRHARKFFIKTEIILEGDRRVGLILFAHFNAFLRLDRLMQAVGIAAPDHKTARKFVDDDDLAVVDDIFLVERKQVVRFERLLNVVVERSVGNVGNVLDAEEFFGFFRAVFGEFDLFVAAFDDKVPVKLFGFGDLLRARIALLLFAAVLFGVFEVVVESAFEGADEFIDAHIKIGRLVAPARNDERSSRFVDENGVDLVDDGKIQLALYHARKLGFEVVAQVIEPELVVRAVNDVACVSGALVLVFHAGNDDADRQPHEFMHLAHPFRVAAGKIIVYGDDVHALARKRFEIARQGCDKRFSFTRLHFGDAPLKEADAADDLHMEVPHAEHAPARFAQGGKGVVQNIVERFAVFKTVFQYSRLRFEFGVGHGGIFGRERLHLVRHFIELFQTPAAVAVFQITDQSHFSLRKSVNRLLSFPLFSKHITYLIIVHYF